MIPVVIKDALEKKLTPYFESEVCITGAWPVSGGSINSCYRLETTSGQIFLKRNDENRYPLMFSAETEGLKLLGKSNAFSIPGVIAFGDAGHFSYLLLEWVEPGRRIENFWSHFGNALAVMHRCTSDMFGLHFNNYIGSLAQSNAQCETWTDFFIRERLEPQLKMAINSGKLQKESLSMFNRLFARLDEWIPSERPALLHGDLWSGNFLTGNNGNATLVDPAVYYGHREMDLAMSKLFGGFDSGFYSAYQMSFPLHDGFEKRKDIHNLYPLLVHVNLFGGGYAGQVNSILVKYT